jgi:UrcA family protein
MLTQRIKAAISLAVLMGTSVFAQAAQDTLRTQEVRFSDLNLETPAGSEALYRRIAVAAEVVCQDYDGREIMKRRLREKCMGNAIGQAVGQINHPRLSAYYSLHNRGKSPPTAAQGRTLAVAGGVLVAR